jgi:thiosulfate/3-mercaptopyruvate sulfurtransferase
MDLPPNYIKGRLASATLSLALVAAVFAYQASSPQASQTISAEELVKILHSPKSEKPLLIQVGSHVLYAQAHIPGSEYIGPGASESGLRQLRKRVESLPRNKFVVIYCGCCPWAHCPNVRPAYDSLLAMGFTNLRVLYLANNFGADWVDRGYPTAKGE